MVHLTLNGIPICHFMHQHCQFPTRQDAYAALLRIDGDVTIVLGPCPHTTNAEVTP